MFRDEIAKDFFRLIQAARHPQANAPDASAADWLRVDLVKLPGGVHDIVGKAVIQRFENDAIKLIGIVPLSPDGAREDIRAPFLLGDENLTAVPVERLNEVEIVPRIPGSRLGRGRQNRGRRCRFLAEEISEQAHAASASWRSSSSVGSCSSKS